MEKGSFIKDSAKKIGKIVELTSVALYKARVERILIPLLILNLDSTGEWIGPAFASMLLAGLFSGLGRQSVAEGLGSGFGAGAFVLIADRKTEILDADTIELYFWAGVFIVANVAPHVLGKIFSTIDQLRGE